VQFMVIRICGQPGKGQNPYKLSNKETKQSGTGKCNTTENKESTMNTETDRVFIHRELTG